MSVYWSTDKTKGREGIKLIHIIDLEILSGNLENDEDYENIICLILKNVKIFLYIPFPFSRWHLHILNCSKILRSVRVIFTNRMEPTGDTIFNSVLSVYLLFAVVAWILLVFRLFRTFNSCLK